MTGRGGRTVARSAICGGEVPNDGVVRSRIRDEEDVAVPGIDRDTA
jgi:hypothetical protein